MVWATVSSRSCFCWLHRASPSSAAKNITNLLLILTIWWCPCVESSVLFLEDGVCYDQQNGQSTSLELDLGSKARFEERAFQEREANLQAAFWQGVVRNCSSGHSVNTCPEDLSMAEVTHLLRSHRSQGTASRGSPGWHDFEYTCLGVVRGPYHVCLAISRNCQNFVAWSTPSVKLYHVLAKTYPKDKPIGFGTYC